jgi:hypothetical protein
MSFRVIRIRGRKGPLSGRIEGKLAASSHTLAHARARGSPSGFPSLSLFHRRAPLKK